MTIHTQDKSEVFVLSVQQIFVTGMLAICFPEMAFCMWYTDVCVCLYATICKLFTSDKICYAIIIFFPHIDDFSEKFSYFSLFCYNVS